MANETFALTEQSLTPDRLAEDDYQSFCAALGASERGRAFLLEYARRNRHADTEVVLAALHRLQQTAHSEKAEPEADRIRQDVRALLDTLRTARPQIDNSPGAIKAATLASLIDFAQARLEALVSTERMLPRGTLAQVPDLDQPELPIPRPQAVSPPAIALVQTVAEPIPVPMPVATQVTTPVADSQPAGLKSDLAEPTAGISRPRNLIPIPEVDFVGRAGTEAPAKSAPSVSGPAKPAPAMSAPAVEPLRFETPMPVAPPDSAEPPAKVVNQDVAQDVAKTIEPKAALAAQAEAKAQAETTAEGLVTEQSQAPAELKAETAIELEAEAPQPAAVATPAQPVTDPLAAIMELSEDERIALFT